MCKIIKFPVTEKMKAEKTYKLEDLFFMPGDTYWKCGKITIDTGGEYDSVLVLITENGNMTSFYLYDNETKIFYIERQFYTTSSDFVVQEEWEDLYKTALSALINSFSNDGAKYYEDVLEGCGWPN